MVVTKYKTKSWDGEKPEKPEKPERPEPRQEQHWALRPGFSFMHTEGVGNIKKNLNHGVELGVYRPRPTVYGG